MPKRESAPIACTLDLQAMAPRLAEIRQLTREHLRFHHLNGRTLRLTYDIEAADRVAHIVGLERACCAFLDFELSVAHTGVELTITAPEQEGTDANWLFAQFLPDPDLSDAPVSETGKCACCRG
jgi:hypothetical protein